ncbi:MAG TPA: dipeptide epimerase [Chitinophagaceae bacterium]|nr:dipeptide epimerase [Chitinophagaceae bacterium]
MADKQIISQVEIYKLRIPLIEPFITSLAYETHVENVIVVMRTENGMTGFGECSPYMPVNGESIDTCFIVGQYFAKLFKGKNALDLEEKLSAMDRLIYGNTSIKSAYDMALHDIIGQHKNVPLYKLYGGKNDKELVTDYTVSLDQAEKMATDALKIKNAGYPSIKVKLGEAMKKDVERIRMIREAVGYTIPVRIDANQGWSVKEAIKTLNALAEYDVEHCEEPIAKWNFMQLRKVKKKSPIPIMADESCGDAHDAERLLKLKACDMFNIKVGKAGGVFNAYEIVKLGDKAKMHMQVGAFLESRLGMTASAHLALCSDNIVHCDFDTPLMFSEDIVSGGLTYHANGVMKVPDVPGLGASIEQSELDKLEKVVI